MVSGVGSTSLLFVSVRLSLFESIILSVLARPVNFSLEMRTVSLPGDWFCLGAKERNKKEEWKNERL